MSKKGMHTGRIETNIGMQRLLSALMQRGDVGATGLELQQVNNDLAISTNVSALRHELERRQEGTVECRFESVNENGRRVYRYFYRARVVSAPVGELFA